MSSREGACINVTSLHLPAVRWCWGKHFFIFFLPSLTEKMLFLHELHIVNSTQGRSCCHERGVRRGPSLRYFSQQFSPVATWAGDNSHLLGHWNLVLSLFPCVGLGGEEGAPGRRQLLLWLARAAAGATTAGAVCRLCSLTGLSNLVPSWRVTVLAASSSQLYSMGVLLCGRSLLGLAFCTSCYVSVWWCSEWVALSRTCKLKTVCCVTQAS